jgi:hypothetical protein
MQLYLALGEVFSETCPEAGSCVLYAAFVPDKCDRTVLCCR